MTEFQKQVVKILKENGGRMTTKRVAEKVGRAEKSVKKALSYLHGAEIVMDHQKAPAREVPCSEQEMAEWREEVEEWKESDDPNREDRWELIPEGDRKKTLEL